MAKITFDTLVEDQEIDKFLSMTEHHSGVRLPMAYAKNAKIVGAYINGHLAAGYMLVTKPDFRTLMFVPDRIKRTDPFFKKSSYEMLEVNGLWVGPAIKTPKLQLRFWSALIFDIFFARKKYLLLMSSLKNKPIQKLHNMANPAVLYEGAPYLASGQSSHSEIRVSYTTRWKLLLNFPRYLGEINSRNQRIRDARKAKQAQAMLDSQVPHSSTLSRA